MMKNTVFTLGLSLTLGISSLSQAEEAGQAKGNRPDLRSLDKDGDRAISKEEAGPAIWARLSKLDKNSDGKVAGEEFARPGGASGATGKGNPGEFLKRMDKNGDGNISKDEVPGQAWERLAKLDENGDNSISKEEFIAGAKSRMSGDFFAQVDKNQDGKLTESEAPRLWEKISKADRDKDGAVSKEELAAARSYADRAKGGMARGGKGNTGGPLAIFGKYDGDKDGKLSKEEVPEELWGKLSRADKNADGLVSRDELGSVYQKMQGMNPGKDADKPKRPAMEKTEA